jgi:hypothetical protein
MFLLKKGASIYSLSARKSYKIPEDFVAERAQTHCGHIRFTYKDGFSYALTFTENKGLYKRITREQIGEV